MKTPTSAAPRALLITFEQLVAIVGPGLADQSRRELLAEGAVEAFTPPAIGEYWVGQGGIYAGQVREEDGSTYHQIKAPVKPPRLMNHSAATKWAAALVIDGHSDFTLPTVRGSSLLFANLRHLFERAWYWTSETYKGNASYAWGCGFGSGNTGYCSKSYERQAVAVRRFKG